jgi:hypothetical protein
MGSSKRIQFSLIYIRHGFFQPYIEKNNSFSAFFYTRDRRGPRRDVFPAFISASETRTNMPLSSGRARVN